MLCSLQMTQLETRFCIYSEVVSFLCSEFSMAEREAKHLSSIRDDSFPVRISRGNRSNIIYLRKLALALNSTIRAHDRLFITRGVRFKLHDIALIYKRKGKKIL